MIKQCITACYIRLSSQTSQSVYANPCPLLRVHTPEYENSNVCVTYLGHGTPYLGKIWLQDPLWKIREPLEAARCSEQCSNGKPLVLASYQCYLAHIWHSNKFNLYLLLNTELI